MQNSLCKNKTKGSEFSAYIRLYYKGEPNRQGLSSKRWPELRLCKGESFPIIHDQATLSLQVSFLGETLIKE